MLHEQLEGGGIGKGGSNGSDAKIHIQKNWQANLQWGLLFLGR